jgi:hypothetical protein
LRDLQITVGVADKQLRPIRRSALQVPRIQRLGNAPDNLGYPIDAMVLRVVDRHCIQQDGEPLPLNGVFIVV